MALFGLGEVVRNGKKLVVVKGTLDGAGLLVVNTPFSVIEAASATVEKATAPTTSAITYDISGNTVTIRGWKATAAGDTTLIASDAGEDVSVMIFGRRP